MSQPVPWGGHETTPDDLGRVHLVPREHDGTATRGHRQAECWCNPSVETADGVVYVRHRTDLTARHDPIPEGL